MNSSHGAIIMIKNYYGDNLSDAHPTVQFFMCARWFNIDGMTPLPEECEDATEHIPWAWKYYEGDDDMQDQLQREWTEYATEFLRIQKQAIELILIKLILCVYNYYLSQLDAVNLNSTHKR
eukprot:517792_1